MLVLEVVTNVCTSQKKHLFFFCQCQNAAWMKVSQKPLHTKATAQGVESVLILQLRQT